MLTWETFFDFNSSKPLDDAIKKIELLGDTYVGMEQTIVASSKRMADGIVDVQEAAAKLATSTKQLNPALDGTDEALAAAAKQSEALVAQFTALKKVEDDNAKLISKLTEELKKLKEAKEKLKTQNEAEAGSYDDIRIRLAEAEKAYKAMGAATSQAVKDEQLAKVKGLAAEFKNVSGALNDAKKGAQAAAGSYNELAARVNDAKKRLKEMEGGLDKGGKEFKELQQFVKEGSDQLKEFDEKIGDNQRKVGDYAGEISKLSPQFGALVGGIDGATKASLAFIATPLGATLALIAAAVASLTAYFNGSIEGQDRMNSLVNDAIAIFSILKDVLKAVGKVLFETFSDPGKLFGDIGKAAEDAGTAIEDAFNSPIETIKSFGKAVYEFGIKSLQGMALTGKAVREIFSGEFKKGFKDLADGIAQSVTGIENATDKIIAALEPLKKELEERRALAAQISALESKLRKDRIADIIDDAQTELQVTKLLVEARDKLRFSDEERFNKLRKANQLLEDQLKGDLQLQRDEIALQELIIQRDGETYDARQKLVELQAQEVELQTKFYAARKKRQAEEIALIREIEKEMIDSRKRVVDSENALNSVRLNDVIKDNQKILAEEESSLEARLQAIAENDAAEKALLEQDGQAQLDAAREAGLARIQLDAETLDAIYNQTELSIQERIQLERTAKEMLLVQDEAYANEVLKIQEDLANKSDELLKRSTKLAEENVFKVMARDAAALQGSIDETTNNALTALNEAFASGDIDSLQEFEDKKLDIQRKSQEESLKSQLKYLQEKASLLKAGTKERQDIETQISQVELKLSEDTAKQRVEYEKALQEELTNLKQVAFESAVSIINSLFEAEEMDRQARLEKLEADYEQQMEMAGDNKAAQIAIENDFNAKKKKIEAEQAAAARKQAIFNKAMAITEIAINTAKGIAWALGSFPPPASIILAAVVGAAGALQIAAVAARPIPQFAKGTDDAPGGWSVINELGPERIVEPSGKTHTIYTDGPTLAYIPRHSKIFTADETKRLEEAEHFNQNVNNVMEGRNTVIRVSEQQHDRQLEEVLRGEMAALRHTVQSKKMVSVNFTKGGVYALIKDAASTTKFLNDYFD